MAQEVTHRISVNSAVSGAQPISLHLFDDLVRGAANVRMEAVASVGHPTQLIPLTSSVGVTTAGYYPADGAGIARATGSTVTALVLAADAPAHGLAGLGVLIVGGTNLGELRGIVAYNTTSKIVTPHRAYATPCDGTTVYRLGIITFCRKWLTIACEYEDAGTAPGQIEPFFYDFPFEVRTALASGDHSGELGIAGVARTARGYAGRRQVIENYGGTLDVRQTGYVTARTASEDAVGSTLAKVRLVVPPAAGKKLSICVGVS